MRLDQLTMTTAVVCATSWLATTAGMPAALAGEQEPALETAPVRVHVFAASDREAEQPDVPRDEIFETASREEREESVEDLEAALDDPKYRSAITVVDTPALADVLIGISWRGSLVTEQRVAFGPIRSGGAMSIGTPRRVAQDNLLVQLATTDRVEPIWAIPPGDKDFLGRLRHLDWPDLAEKVAEASVAIIRTQAAQADRPIP